MSKNFETTSLTPGSRLDAYVIERVLSRGPYSYTYLAKDAARQDYLIREFLPHEFAERDADGSVRARDAEDRNPLRFWLRAFLEKAAQVARLSHPNLPQVLRQFEANGTGYVVSAYRRGQTLQSLLEHEGTLGENPLRRVLLGVLGALDAAHAAGIQHRNLSLEHIWVRDNDEGPELLDFGVLRGPVRMRSRLVSSEAVPPYAAPEEAIPNTVYGPSTDLYALGVIAYTALSGELPPSAQAREQGGLLKPTADATRVRCSETFAQAVDWALQLPLDSRPQTVSAWRESLRGSGAADLPGLGSKSGAGKGKGSPLRYVVPVVALVVVAAGAYVLVPHSAPPPAKPTAAAASATQANSADAGASAAAPAPAEAEPSALDRLALDFLSRDKKAQEQRQKEQADRDEREARAREQATKAAAAPAPAPPPAPVAAAPAPDTSEALARQKALEQEVERLRAENEARKRNEEADAKAQARAEQAAKEAAKQNAAKAAEAQRVRQAQAIASARKNCALPAMELSEAGNLTFYNALSVPGAQELATGVIRLPPLDLDDGTKAVFEITPDSCAHRIR